MARPTKAIVRYMQQESGASETECLGAFNAASGDLMLALKRLAPGRDYMPYHDVYFLGPYRRVENPDQDLPRLESTADASLDYVLVKDMNGQRCIPPFRDTNELSDILGRLYLSASYPKWEDWAKFEGPTIQGSLMIAGDRIRDKLHRNKNPERGEYFKVALASVESASDHYFVGRYDAGAESVWEAVHALQTGNRLRKRV